MTKAERDAQRLFEDFRAAFLADFYERGPETLDRLRATDPAGYARVVAEAPWLPRLCAAIVARRGVTLH